MKRKNARGWIYSDGNQKPLLLMQCLTGQTPTVRIKSVPLSLHSPSHCSNQNLPIKTGNVYIHSYTSYRPSSIASDSEHTRARPSQISHPTTTDYSMNTPPTSTCFYARLISWVFKFEGLIRCIDRVERSEYAGLNGEGDVSVMKWNGKGSKGSRRSLSNTTERVIDTVCIDRAGGPSRRAMERQRHYRISNRYWVSWRRSGSTDLEHRIHAPSLKRTMKTYDWPL